jgi:hypothetical protein
LIADHSRCSSSRLDLLESTHTAVTIIHEATIKAASTPSMTIRVSPFLILILCTGKGYCRLNVGDVRDNAQNPVTWATRQYPPVASDNTLSKGYVTPAYCHILG